MEAKSLLIKDTTKEQREEIVRQGLCSDSCGDCSQCGSYGVRDLMSLYQKYIDGKMELFEINLQIRGGTVR